MVFGSAKKVEKKSWEYAGIQPAHQIAPVTQEEPSSSSYLGKTMNIQGELISDEDLTIEGKVKGTIRVSKTLTIGREGDVTADIIAKVVKIIGKARGTIIASDKVAILSEGRYEGAIKSEKLVVAEGAILIGHINQEEEPPKQKALPEQKSSKKNEIKKPDEEKENTDKDKDSDSGEGEE